ncbi:MAG: S-layer homology domain-containing protein, partial [Actinomycetota bacterium]
MRRRWIIVPLALAASIVVSAPPSSGADSICGRDGDLPFTDIDPTDWAYADIACIHDLAITTGTTPTTYSPDDPVTRR